MARFYRYRLPPWALKCLLIIEAATLPILIFQIIRTIIFPTSLDVILILLLAALFCSFYLKWI